MQTKTSLTHPVSSLSLRLWSEAAVLGMITMELTWITAWYILTTQPQSSLGTTILILGLALAGSYGLGRAVSALHWRLAIRRFIFLAWLVFYVFFSLKVLLFPQIGLVLAAPFTHPLSAIFANPWGGDSSGTCWLFACLGCVAPLYLQRWPTSLVCSPACSLAC